MKRAGYFLLSLSFLIWGLVFLLPFTGLSATEMAGYAVTLYVFSYALFFGGALLVGKEAISGLKKALWAKIGRTDEPEIMAEDESLPEP